MRAQEVPVQLQKEIWYPLKAKQCGGTQMWATLYFLPDSVLTIHEKIQCHQEKGMCYSVPSVYNGRKKV